VRFWQNPSLGFAPATLESFSQGAAQAVPRLAVRFFGLFGPNAPLPPHITEYAYDRQLHHGDKTITAFFNVFHHRLLSFFYRAWAPIRKRWTWTVRTKRASPISSAAFWASAWSHCRGAMPCPTRRSSSFPDGLGAQTRNAEGLESLLRAFFHIPTEVQTFVGRWLDLPADCVCKLGDSPATGGLGTTSIVGSRVWDCQLSFRLRMGPMGLADYERMLPQGDSFARLRDWVLNYCGRHYFWDVQLVLEAAAVPSTCLGHAGRLGWTTWLKTQPVAHDLDDLILTRPPNN